MIIPRLTLIGGPTVLIEIAGFRLLDRSRRSMHLVNTSCRMSR